MHQHVIVKAKPGYEAWARQLLQQNGKTIDAELPSIGGIAVELTAAELDVLQELGADRLFGGLVHFTERHDRPDAEGATALAVLDLYGRRSMSTLSVNTLLGTLGLDAVGELRLRRHGRVDRLWHLSVGGVRRAASRRSTTSPPAATIAKAPFDDYGHGTHVAGLIGGLQSLADIEYEGVAPAVQFVGLKVLDKNGGGRTSDVIRAIEFAIANKQKFGIDIINLSLGHPIFEPAATDPLVQAVEKATKAGIIVVASRGQPRRRRGRQIWLRGHHLAGQRAVGDHGWRGRSQGDASRATTIAWRRYSSNGPT